METLALSIADIELRLEVPPKAADDMRPEWGGFSTNSTDNATVHLETYMLKGVADPERVFELPAVRECTAGHLRITQADLFDMRLNLIANQGLIQYRGLEQMDRAGRGPAGLRGALAVLLATLLPIRGGLLLHASGVRLGDKGVAFVGPREAGKSTICAMFPHETILNDELVAVTNASSAPRVHATPFSGPLSDPRFRQHCPLRLALKIRKSSQAKLLPLSPSDAFRLLMQCTALPGGCQELGRVAFRVAGHLLADTNWGTLEFSQDKAQVVCCVEEALAALY